MSSPAISRNVFDSGLERIAASRSVSGSTLPFGPATDQTLMSCGSSALIEARDSHILNPGVGPSAMTALAFDSHINLDIWEASSIQLMGNAMPADIAPRYAQKLVGTAGSKTATTS